MKHIPHFIIKDQTNYVVAKVFSPDLTLKEMRDILKAHKGERIMFLSYQKAHSIQRKLFYNKRAERESKLTKRDAERRSKSTFECAGDIARQFNESQEDYEHW